MNYFAPINQGESRANLGLDKRDQAELDRRIQTALGYMKPERIANYLAVPLSHVIEVRNRTPYYRVKGLRDIIQGGLRRG